eukprot:TRINITY_DN32105_c0_g1_i1.p1 TRINITY_DN32105_c0_g1~~TRINITY_DN32105_c0_g1_i1.p1  ORF type:complete len:215 (+),score=14.16 TRINITY_DN32105_c0_g1_i1:47-691(+)
MMIAGSFSHDLRLLVPLFFFFFNDAATPEIYTILFVGSVRCVQETAYGVSKIRKWSCAKRLDLCKVFVDFRGELSEHEIEKLMIGSGIAGTGKEARELWFKAVELEEREVYNGWTKRCTQILSGKSKFCTMIVSGGREFFIRHSVCYESPPGMEDFKSEMLGSGREYSTAEAEKLWLESFKRQLLRQHQDDLPLAWERDGGKSVLYYAYTERKK